jgi:hypothetical protein
MSMIDDLQDLDLHRNLPFRMFSTGWVKDTEILGSTSVRPDMTNAEMLDVLRSSEEKGLLVIKNLRDPDGILHAYFRIQPRFRQLYPSHTHTTNRQPTEAVGSQNVGSSRNHFNGKQHVSSTGQLKRGATPGPLPRAQAQKQASAITGWQAKVSMGQSQARLP